MSRPTLRISASSSSGDSWTRRFLSSPNSVLARASGLISDNASSSAGGAVPTTFENPPNVGLSNRARMGISILNRRGTPDFRHVGIHRDYVKCGLMVGGRFGERSERDLVHLTAWQKWKRLNHEQ